MFGFHIECAQGVAGDAIGWDHARLGAAKPREFFFQDGHHPFTVVDLGFGRIETLEFELSEFEEPKTTGFAGRFLAPRLPDLPERVWRFDGKAWMQSVDGGVGGRCCFWTQSKQAISARDLGESDVIAGVGV